MESPQREQLMKMTVDISKYLPFDDQSMITRKGSFIRLPSKSHDSFNVSVKGTTSFPGSSLHDEK